MGFANWHKRWPPRGGYRNLTENLKCRPWKCCFPELFLSKNSNKKQWGREHFVPRLALEIQRSISGWDLPSWLPSLLNFTNILASLARSRGSPNIHKVLKNDSKRKENVQKGSPVVFTTQNSLKVLRIESVVPRFLLFPAITFPSQNEQNRLIS